MPYCCCFLAAAAERMDNFIAGLTNNDPTKTAPRLNNVQKCGVGAVHAPAGATLASVCSPENGPARYVVILTEGEFLTVREVQVYGTGTVCSRTNIHHLSV